jgi:hypothetical protein
MIVEKDTMDEKLKNFRFVLTLSNSLKSHIREMKSRKTKLSISERLRLLGLNGFILALSCLFLMGLPLIIMLWSSCWTEKPVCFVRVFFVQYYHSVHISC